MHRWIIALVGSLFLFAGCADPSATTPTVTPEVSDTGAADPQGEEHAAAATGEHDHTMFCGSCGQVAGADECCKEGAEKCEACKLAKGSPLCCKIEGDFTGKKLCGGCGEVGGSEKCCSEGAEKCAACELHKGSPLCCKLEKKSE